MTYSYVLSITDNGTGFSPEKKSRSGMGLHIMQFRARSIGGHLTVESQTNQNRGTQIKCTVPAKFWTVKP